MTRWTQKELDQHALKRAQTKSTTMRARRRQPERDGGPTASTIQPSEATVPRTLELRLPRRLDSPNKWQGRHWRVKHRLSKDWELAIGHRMADQFVIDNGGIDFPNALGAIMGPKKWVGYIAPKTRVTVERHVPSLRNFIRDDDNLRFAVKPLLDALKRQGYIRDDSRKWLEHPTPTQHVSADGKDWTVIRISPVEEPKS